MSAEREPRDPRRVGDRRGRDRVQRRAGLDVLQIPRVLGGVISDIRAIAEGMAMLPKLLVSLDGIKAKVESSTTRSTRCAPRRAHGRRRRRGPGRHRSARAPSRGRQQGGPPAAADRRPQPQARRRLVTPQRRRRRCSPSLAAAGCRRLRRRPRRRRARAARRRPEARRRPVPDLRGLEAPCQSRRRLRASACRRGGGADRRARPSRSAPSTGSSSLSVAPDRTTEALAVGVGEYARRATACAEPVSSRAARRGREAATSTIRGDRRGRGARDGLEQDLRWSSCGATGAACHRPDRRQRRPARDGPRARLAERVVGTRDRCAAGAAARRSSGRGAPG